MLQEQVQRQHQAVMQDMDKLKFDQAELSKDPVVIGERKHSSELEEIVDPDLVLFMFMFISLGQMFIAILILCSSKNELLSPLLSVHIYFHHLPLWFWLAPECYADSCPGNYRVAAGMKKGLRVTKQDKNDAPLLNGGHGTLTPDSLAWRWMNRGRKEYKGTGAWHIRWPGQDGRTSS